MKEKKARVEDAYHATKAALDEGIVPGGGVALIRASASLKEVKLPGDRRLGVEILKRALELPARTIAENAGTDGSVVARNIRKNSGNYGYDANEDRYGDMIEFGVVDPTKVVRSALENAVSVAGVLLTTECLIATKPEKEDDDAGGGEGMDEDM
jgi:chaperonin GroEL